MEDMLNYGVANRLFTGKETFLDTCRPIVIPATLR